MGIVVVESAVDVESIVVLDVVVDLFLKKNSRKQTHTHVAQGVKIF